MGHRLAGLIPRLVQGDLQVLGEDGQVITVTVTPGKVVGVTSTLLTIERRDGQQAQFSVATTTPVIKGKHRVGLDALEEGNPVVVIQKDGDVVAVIVGAPHPPKPRLRPRDREEPGHPPEFRGRPGKALERVLRNFGEQMKRQQHALGEHLGRMQHRIDSLEARIATLEEAAQ